MLPISKMKLLLWLDLLVMIQILNKLSFHGEVVQMQEIGIKILILKLFPIHTVPTVKFMQVFMIHTEVFQKKSMQQLISYFKYTLIVF